MYTLLLVDDEPHVRQAIIQMCDMQRLGIGRVIQSDNGVDALALIRQENPDIVITDMKMPLSDGADLLRKCREIGFEGKVIVLSGFDNFEYTREGIRFGVFDYLLKPINPHELYDTLEKAVCAIGNVTPQSSFIEEIKSYIGEHYAEEISLDFFCKKYFLSKAYILRRFKEKFGMGIYEWVMIVRMNEAKRFLTQTDEQIQEIAHRVGFNDSHYFSKAFKNRFGISPKEIRKP